MRPALSVLLSVLHFSLLACRPASPPPAPTDIRAHSAASLPSGPGDAAWALAAEFTAPLLPQDMVEPRALERTTPHVRVRAVCDGRRVAFRLEWPDSTRNDEQRPGAFSDACAVQFPSQVQADLPAPQMGELGKDVEILFWRATWQAALSSSGPALAQLYPNASIDHYPFQARSESADMAARYSPARAVENDLALPRSTPVEVLVASGPGTLRPGARDSEASGAGVRTDAGWSVVLARPLPRGFEGFGRTQVAFAVWDGAHGEVGARKMRTVWIPFAMEVQP
jgi:DMSO reductase family type II enzyme heme b subunit